MEHNPASNARHETFVRLYTKYEGNVRAFVSSLLPHWEGVDEVMQEASLVMWRKFDQFDTESPQSSFLNWAFMIARYETLRYRRGRATDRLVFSEDVYALLSSEAEEVAVDQTAREQALRNCLGKLDAAQQSLVNKAYADGICIKDAADSLGRTPTGLYKALARIRRHLHRCIQLTISEEKMKGAQ